MLLLLMVNPLSGATSAEPSITTPAPVASIVSPLPVMDGSCEVRKIVAGKTAGSNVIVVATPSPFAARMACLKLPTPALFVLVTTMAHDDEAPKSRKLKTSANWKRYCAGCDRLTGFFIVIFSFFVLRSYPRIVIGWISVIGERL